MDILKYKQVRTIAIIAEGVPERQTRLINKKLQINLLQLLDPQLWVELTW